MVKISEWNKFISPKLTDGIQDKTKAQAFGKIIENLGKQTSTKFHRIIHFMNTFLKEGKWDQGEWVTNATVSEELRNLKNRVTDLNNEGVTNDSITLEDLWEQVPKLINQIEGIVKKDSSSELKTALIDLKKLAREISKNKKIIIKLNLDLNRTRQSFEIEEKAISQKEEVKLSEEKADEEESKASDSENKANDSFNEESILDEEPIEEPINDKESTNTAKEVLELPSIPLISNPEISASDITLEEIHEQIPPVINMIEEKIPEATDTQKEQLQTMLDSLDELEQTFPEGEDSTLSLEQSINQRGLSESSLKKILMAVGLLFTFGNVPIFSSQPSEKGSPPDVVKDLLKARTDENTFFFGNEGPLKLALTWGLPDELTMAIAEKTDPRNFVLDGEESKLLHEAINSKNYNTLNMLLSQEIVSNYLVENESDTKSLLREAFKRRDYRALKLLSQHVSPKVFLTFFTSPTNNAGVSHLDKAMKEGNLELINIVLNASDNAEIAEHPEVFISKDTVEGCLADSEFQKILELPLEEIVFPLNLSQSFCDTNIRLRDGSILRLKNTNAVTVFHYLMEKKYEVKDATPYEFTVYLSPGHAFFSFDAQVQGFYPAFAPISPSLIFAQVKQTLDTVVSKTISEGIRNAVIYLGYQKGYIKNEYKYLQLSEDENHPKIKFLLDDQQMGKLKSHFENLSKLCKSKSPDCYYQLWTRNCVDFVQELFQSADGIGFFADFLTINQLGDVYPVASDPVGAYEVKAAQYSLLRSRGPVNYFRESSMKSTQQALKGVQNYALSSDVRDFVSKNDPAVLIQLGMVCAALGTKLLKKMTSIWNVSEGEPVENHKVKAKLKLYLKEIATLEEKSRNLRDEFNRLKIADFEPRSFLVRPENKGLWIDYADWKPASDQLVEINFSLIELKEMCEDLSGKRVIREPILKELDDKIQNLNKELEELSQHNKKSTYHMGRRRKKRTFGIEE